MTHVKNPDDYWTTEFQPADGPDRRPIHDVKRKAGHALARFVEEVGAPLWMVADGAAIDGLAECLEGSGLEHHCLFADATFRHMTGAAPWLISVDRADGLARQMLDTDCCTHWSLWRSGILLSSAATGPALARHMRRAILRRINGRRVFHRFWEPNAVFDYFRALTSLPDRASQTFSIGADRIDGLMAYDGLCDRSVVVTCSEVDRSVGFEPELHRVEVEALLAAVLRPYAIDMAVDLAETEPTVVGHLDGLELEDALTESCVRLHGHGFRDLGLMRELALQDVWQGGPFEDEDGALLDICARDTDEHAKYAALSRRIMELA